MRHYSQLRLLVVSCRYAPFMVALLMALVGATILWVPAAQAVAPVAYGVGEVGPAAPLAPMASANPVLTVAPQPTVYGQSLTMTATVQSVTGTLTLPAPTGSVTFWDGGTPLGTAILAGGVETYTAVATFTTTVLNVGSHSLQAQYLGDDIYDSGNSPDVAHTVNKAATTAVVVPSPNPAVRGEIVTIAATVLPQAPGSGTPDGNVTFKDGATVLHVVELVGGTASFVTADLTLGEHPLTVEYGGSAAFIASSSEVVTETINKADTAVFEDSAPRPSVFGELVTITATVVVTAPGSGIPTGNVTFKDSDTVLGTVPLVNGVASLATAGFAVGVHVITVEYSGDADRNPSTSAGYLHTVNLAESATTFVGSDPNPSIFTVPVTFTATVTAVAPGAGVPTGTVNIFEGPTVVATGTAIAGVAVIVTPDLSVGTHVLTVVYAGNEEFVGSTSEAFEQVVVRAPTTVTLEAASNVVQVGLRVSLTATVSSTFGTPTSGTVTFRDGTNVLGTAPMVGGVATLGTFGLGAGPHLITAEYSGDAVFAPSTSEVKEVTIDQRATNTVLGSSPNPSNIGRPANFVALVSPAVPVAVQAAGPDATDANVPTGLVFFSDPTGALSATATLQGGVATLVTPALPAGIYSVTAQYFGDAAYAPSFSLVVIHEVVDAVFATNDAAGTAFATPVTINVLANDTGSDLAVADVSDPANGATVINPDNSISYTPDVGFFGIDTFTYVARDSGGNFDGALVTVIVAPAIGTNTPPSVGVIEPTEPQTITFPAPGATTIFNLLPGLYPQPLGDKDLLYLVFAALTSPTHNAPTGQQYAGFSFALSAFLNNTPLPTFQLGQPVTLTIDYDPAILGAVDPETLGLYYWNGTQWSAEGITLVSHDVVNGVIVYRLAHLSEFAFFAVPHVDLYFPIVARR